MNRVMRAKRHFQENHRPTVSGLLLEPGELRMTKAERHSSRLGSSSGLRLVPTVTLRQVPNKGGESVHRKSFTVKKSSHRHPSKTKTMAWSIATSRHKRGGGQA